jgi:hypothetical protein
VYLFATAAGQPGFPVEWLPPAARALYHQAGRLQERMFGHTEAGAVPRARAASRSIRRPPPWLPGGGANPAYARWRDDRQRDPAFRARQAAAGTSTRPVRRSPRATGDAAFRAAVANLLRESAVQRDWNAIAGHLTKGR